MKPKRIIIPLTILLIVLGFYAFADMERQIAKERPKDMMDEMKTQIATFAGGCFWCMEADFEKVRGVQKVISGYTGGHKAHPSYKEVSRGGTGHTESIQVYFNPEIVTYKELLDYFWHHINPTDAGGQFVDPAFGTASIQGP